MGERVEFHVLGPLRVFVDGAEVPIAARRQRALLVLLALNVGRVVPVERLIDQLWDGNPPPQGAVTLRSYVSNIRQALGGQSGLGQVLVTRGQGYSIDVPAESVDAVRLATGARLGRQHLRNDRPIEALTAFDAALSTWTGNPLAEVADHEALQSTVTQLTETYLGAMEGRFEALLASGRHGDALPELEAFAADHPLREEPVALLMLGLYRAGRAAEALELHQACRARLRDELGIDPSARLNELYQRILEQDTALAAPLRPLDAESAAATDQPLIVGREREQAALTSRLDEAIRGGTGALVLIGGEPGIGKTTLLELLERQARQRDVAVHAARTPATSGAPAFWLWSRIVDSVAADLDDDQLRNATQGAARPVAQLSATVAQRTGQAMPMLGDDPQTLRFLLYEAVAAFLRQATVGPPMLVTLDDIHWADASSLELLSYLTPGLATQPLLVVAAYRDLPTEATEALTATLATVSREDVAHELALTGLSADDVGDLVDALLTQMDRTGPEPADKVARGGRSGRFAALLHERTGGNPFFVRQLGRLLLEHEDGDVDLLSVPAPPGVRHVIGERLRALSEPAQQLLSAAAVIGRDFDLRTAAHAADIQIDRALDAFDEAAGHGLVEAGPDGQSEGGADRRFVHALVQEVVLDALPPGRAVRLHARVGARLEQDGTARPDELARHMWAAKDMVGARAVPSLVSAADAAADVYALDQAETHLRHALELVRTDPDSDPTEELSLLLGLFRLIVIDRGWGHVDVEAVVARALALVDAGAYNDHTSRLWWSMFFFLLDRDDKSYIKVADSLLEAVEGDEAGKGSSRIGQAARAVVHLTNIFSALHRDERDQALTHLRAARRHVEAAPAADLAAFDEHLHVMLLLVEGYWAALTGDRATYRATASAAVALADADGRPFPRAVARTLAAASGPYLGEVAVVHELATQALELTQRFRFSWLTAVATCAHSWAEASLNGPTAGSAKRIEHFLADVAAADRHGNDSVALMQLADVYELQGRTADARVALERARAQPGSYRGLTLDLIETRIQRLDADAAQSDPSP